MMHGRLMRLTTAWIAFMAILLSALLPAFSNAAHASAADSGIAAFHAEICSAAGRIAAADAQAGGYASVPPDGLHRMDDCPYCRVQAEQPALPPVHLGAPLRIDASPLFPPLYYRSPGPLFAWTSAQPRAPPLLPL